MGDSDWMEVSRKKRRSVFDRLNYPHAKTSNADDLAKISLSVYVSNFPSHLTKRELWNICGKLGTLADVFIAGQKNKLGQMYAFCRYIKVANTETLIDALCKIRIGKLRLHAKVARFSRNDAGSYSQKSVRNANPNTTCVNNKDCKDSFSNKVNSYANVAKGSFNSGSFGDKANHADNGGNLPSININDPNTNDFPLALIGCYKDFRAIANTRSMCRCEVFLDVEFKYLRGLWVLFEFSSHEVKDNFQKHKGILCDNPRISVQ
ncbi:RNA-directed DNA polymerase, eukaryota [Tanacetum coccineum]